jgi:hypothetical protein
MTIPSTYPGSLQKIESDEPIFIDMREVSFLVVPIFRRAIFGVLLAVQTFLVFSYFLGGLLF